MIPQRFANSNIVMRAPQSMENCSDVHAFAGQAGTDPVVITAWRPTREELVKINLGEPIWLYVYGAGMPPVAVTAQNPFEAKPSEE